MKTPPGYLGLWMFALCGWVMGCIAGCNHQDHEKRIKALEQHPAIGVAVYWWKS